MRETLNIGDYIQLPVALGPINEVQKLTITLYHHSVIFNGRYARPARKRVLPVQAPRTPPSSCIMAAMRLMVRSRSLSWPLRNHARGFLPLRLQQQSTHP